MRNNFYIILIIILSLFSSVSLAESLKINSSEVKINKKDSSIVLKGNVEAVDENKNILKSNEAVYLKKNLLNSIGLTSIKTSENYTFESNNVIFDNKNKIIKSDYPTKIIDPDGNIISLSMFNYNSIKNILYSKGNVRLEDKNKNIYKFNQIYIDEKKEKNYRFRCKNIFKR